jgi:HlyD family secretion protein
MNKGVIRMNMRIIAILITGLTLASCGADDSGQLSFTGIMDANTVRVSSETSGRVIELLVDEGADVKKGDAIARLETERIGYQLDQADAQQTELTHSIAAAASRVNAAEIQRNNLAKRLTRFRALLAREAVTQQTVDDLEAQLQSADAEIAAASASLSALRSKQAQLGAGEDLVRKQLRDAEILSPLTGRILVRYTDTGELLGPGSPVCEIADLTDMWTKIYVSETQLPSIMLGQHVQVIIDGTEERLSGTVSWISSSAEFTPKTILTEETRTALVYPVKVRIPNEQQLLKIGMPVTVQLEKTRS